jgi:HEAT repeat protein
MRPRANAPAVVLAPALALALACASPARADPHPHWESRPGSTPSTALSPTGSLLGHVGDDAAARLMRSADADERLRGIERAASLHTSTGLLLLERAARNGGPGGLDPRLPDEGIARTDPRALLAVVRGLADWVVDAPARTDEGARAALVDVVRAPSEFFAGRASAVPGSSTDEDPDGTARVTLARQEAAIALARSGDPVALEQLVTAARSGGAGQEASLLALSIHPPSEPAALGGVALTTPATVALAARIGDLRTLDSILSAVRASDPALRAAAITALGVAGDTRGAEPARAALHDPDGRVRVAAAETLGRLATTDAAPAIEALIEDDATALDGLRVAAFVQGEGLVKAAAARAVATGDPQLRAAALAALGRQVSSLAVTALVTLAGAGPATSDALAALARSPSPAALAAIEGLATSSSESRRRAARAYFVRRFMRGQRSERLEAVLRGLEGSADPRDRAVAAEALVALDERPLQAALGDPDPHVRRAAILGALGAWAPETATRLGARAAVEADPATAMLLAIAWQDPGASAITPTPVLVERANAGGPDAPLAALGLARRDDEKLVGAIDALLHARDPNLRAYAARGLGQSAARDATGRLATAYAWESDANVRRAIVRALAARSGAIARGVGRPVLELAARLDPDAVVRLVASNALAGAPLPEEHIGAGREVAWMSLVPADASNPRLDLAARLVDGEGNVFPVVFDEEGYALVPGVSPGEARVQLAPGLPAYSAPTP